MTYLAIQMMALSVFFAASAPLLAQAVVNPEATRARGSSPMAITAAFSGDYKLGPQDQISIQAFELEEVSDKILRVDSQGSIMVPLLGTVKVGGKTLEGLERELRDLLKPYLKSPQVSVTLVTPRNEFVYLVGAFREPGMYPLAANRKLLQLLSNVGQLQPSAAHRISVTRRSEQGPIPLKGAVMLPDTGHSRVDVSLTDLRANWDVPEDLELKPGDVVRVEGAELVFATGEVTKVGGIELAGRESLSVLQLLSLSGGATAQADLSKALVLRPVLETSRRASIAVDVAAMLRGKRGDFPLQPNDVLFIPKQRAGLSWSKAAAVGVALFPALTIFAVR